MNVSRPLVITIPDFEDDARTQQLYTTSLNRRIAAYREEQTATVQRAFAAKRDAFAAELAAADGLIADRVEAARVLTAAYRSRYPHRMLKTRPVRPSFIEWLVSFGAATRLYAQVTAANAEVFEAQTNRRRVADKHEKADADLFRAVADAGERARETTTSAEWLADIHDGTPLGTLKKRVEAIERERQSYADRLKAGLVSDDEARDRTFARDGVHEVELPLAAMMFYRVDAYGPLVYFILRDLERRLFALPYDPRLESIVDGVFDVYRVAEGITVRQRVHAESKLPFTILDHFTTCNDGDDLFARDAYRDQRAWMKPKRTFGPTPCSLGLEREIISALAEFAKTITSPRAPQIL